MTIGERIEAARRERRVLARVSRAAWRLYQATGPGGKRLHTVTEIAQTVGIHRTTVYDYLNREG